MAKRTLSPKESELPTFRELKAFVAVARCESITRAAEELSYFKPYSVLSHIKTLERAYNVELFFHKRKRMQLTEQGKILYSAAEEILKRMQETATALAAVLKCVTRITFGGPSISLSLMRSVYGCICNENPNLQIRFTNYWESNDVESALLREEVDVGILCKLPGRNADHLELTSFTESVVVAASTNLILGDGTMVTRDQLREQHLILPRTNADQDAVHAEIVSQLGIEFRSQEEVPNLPVAVRLVKMGRGIALLPASTAKEVFDDAASQLLHIVDADPRARLNVAYPLAIAGSPGLKFLLKTIGALVKNGIA